MRESFIFHIQFLLILKRWSLCGCLRYVNDSEMYVTSCIVSMIEVQMQIKCNCYSKTNAQNLSTAQSQSMHKTIIITHQSLH